MLTVLSVVGTRPEAIKMAPVILRLRQHADEIRSVVCSTGQHRQLLDQVNQLFGIVPDIELGIMRPQQTLSDLTARLITAMDETVQTVRPDWILAQGDTTTVLATALVAYYHRVRFGHVEAGLRTRDRYHPFPEEVNRVAADAIAELMFAPTELSRENLLREGHPASRVLVTGNTVIDALHFAANMPYDWSAGPLAGIPVERRLVLVTAHRRESFGEPLRELCTAVRDLADHYSGNGVHFVFPVHPNPNVRMHVDEILAGHDHITLLEPLDYLSLVQLMKRSSLVLTDSGGIQEEAPGLGIPVLVTRERTERPEGVAAGVVKLVGTCGKRIQSEARTLLDDPAAYQAMSRGANPYGDGRAAERIVTALLQAEGGKGAP